MKNIYIGNIDRIYISEISINKGSPKAKIERETVISEAIFYKNLFGKIISFDYNCNLPTEEEATDYVNDSIQRGIDNWKNITCVYVDYDCLKSITTSKEHIKSLKKEYKNQKK